MLLVWFSIYLKPYKI